MADFKRNTSRGSSRSSRRSTGGRDSDGSGSGDLGRFNRRDSGNSGRRDLGDFGSRDSGGFNQRGSSRFGGRGSDRPERTMVTCDSCKKKCEVPFKPSSDKPVYCSDCFRKESPRSDSD